MATFLLIIVYIAFIGLGIPDSLFGAAWPAIYNDFGVGVSYAGFVTVLVSGCTVISSLMSSKVINKFSTSVVTAVSTAMTAAALVGYSISPNLWSMCAFAIVLGLGAGAIDAALNNYIALYYNAMHMNFLHCFYGVGVVVSPYIMSLMLENSTWREGYRAAFYIQLAITIIMILSLPLWKKVRHKSINSEEEITPKVLSIGTMAKTPSIRIVWILCVATNVIEAMCGVWGSTFLVSAHKLSVASAAGAILFFYLGMALGRFLSGIMSTKLSPWKLIYIGTAVVFVAISLMFVPNATVAIVGLFLAGLGNGPIYPNIMYLTPKNFGEDVSQSVIGSQMAFAYGGFLAMPPVFGVLAEYAGAKIFPFFVAFWFAVMLFVMVLFVRKLKAENRYMA